jgi:2-oxoglutarate dehydrogenase E1 component
MSRPSAASRYNLEGLDQMYQQWRQDAGSVPESWRWFFDGFELGYTQLPPTAATSGATSSQTSIVALIDAYRGLGHLLANLDPLSTAPTTIPALELSAFGFTDADLDRDFDVSHFVGMQKATLGQLVAALKETYCRTIGVEYMHIQDAGIRRWLRERMEPRRNQPETARRQRMRILMELNQAELFEEFLHTKFMGQKRFSLEGAETLIPLLNEIVEKAADAGVREIVMGMAHRGRLNVLANVLNKPYTEIFSEFEDNYQPNATSGDGDVKYHLGFSSDRTSSKGNKLHISLTPNPSHLEAVNPVVEGRVRAKQHLLNDRDRRTLVMPLLIHGDAAVAGQGLVAETLNLSQLQGYKTGGTVHVVVNNQIGFTTRPSDSRSTRYCTDIAKMIDAPIFHVNAEDPEACLFIADLAMEFRQTFGRDVVIDMYCWRKWGHNEGDEPSFTQPVTVAKIHAKASISETYQKQLVSRGDMTEDEAESLVTQFKGTLEDAREKVRQMPHYVGMRGFDGRWKQFSPRYTPDRVQTGVSYDNLLKIAEALGRIPEGFTAHPKVLPIIEGRLRDIKEKKPLNWGAGEALAFGSLLLEGTPVRLSGQDSRRGTFSHRHAVIYDTKTEMPYASLQHIDANQAKFSVYDSLLSEAAVLGFEFGYSLDAPNALVMWEAQFGDFVNGAQVIIDQFIVSCNSKWNRDSGLVMLLPHGYEGQGPEHSSARLERFLQLCGEDNIQVCYPTTPAQCFHMLRRQIHRNFRRPLIVMTPKSLLRLPAAVSPVDDFINGYFREVIDDADADAGKVRRVVLCSGKVYYDLVKERRPDDGVAVIRVEQFFPFPTEALAETLLKYPQAREVVWAQEESANMGGWFFMEPRLRAMGFKPKFVGRDASASPAAGSLKVHQREQKDLVETALRGKAPHLVQAAPRKEEGPGLWEREPSEQPNIALETHKVA